VAAIEVQLLGRFLVRRAGDEVPLASFGGRLVRVLIRLLLTRRGTFVSRDVLAEALWPERKPADPTANLRVLVQRARAALGDPSLIVTGPGGYSFAPGAGCEVDTETFLARVQAGQDHFTAGHAAAALRDFRAALDLWSEPLAEDAYEYWAQDVRASLGRAYLQALETAAESALALRDPGQAAALAERAVSREPLREPAVALLARALAASGDQVAALRAIDSLRRRLGDEVGLQPSPEVLALETRLQRGELVGESSRRPLVPTVRPAFEGLTFVGRDDELRALSTTVRGPEPGTVLVAGPAGAGKSRLVAEAAEHSDLPVLAVRAFLPERNEPWGLARAILREALALDLEAARAIPDRAAQALADVLPELEELRPIGSGVVDPESRRALALEGAARVLAIAAGKGALILVDDLQWADATSLGLLGLAARRIPQAGMVLAYRPEEVAVEGSVHNFLDEIRSVREPVEVSVGPLAPDAISILFADAEIAAVIAEATDCTPLAVAEAVRGLAAEGAIEREPLGRWAPCRPDAVQRAREVAHSGQRQAIATRAERQPPDRKEMLRLVALLGREAPARIFARATQIAEASVLDGLNSLARSGLARLGDGGWATAHDLIGEVVAERLDRAERGRLHLLLARALEAEDGDPAEVARHLEGAGDRAAAANSFSEAARQRLMQFAGNESSQLADSGLGLEPHPELRALLLRTRAEARALGGDLAGARDDLRAALPSIPRGPERSGALARIAEITSALDDYVQAGELIDLALAEAGDDRRARAEALAVAAFLDVNRTKIQEGEARAAEALTVFEELGEPTGVASVVDLRAMAAFFRGRLVEAGELFERAARLYRDTGQLIKVGSPRMMWAWMLMLNGHVEEGLEEVEGALELERSLGQAEGEAGGLWLRSEMLTALGRADEAWADARAGLALSRALGHREYISVNLRAVAACCRASGDLDGAEAALREALEICAVIPLQLHLDAAFLSSLLVERGNLEEAERYANDALGGGIGLADFESRLVLAEVALARDDPEAERLAAEALSLADAGGYRFSPARQRLEARVPHAPPAASDVTSRRRELKTFMFTDIVSSTNLAEVLGDEGWDHLLRWHDQTLRSLFAGHRGEEINRIGDGFFVAFERAGDGVRCAVEIQRVLERHRVDHGFAPRVRIGLHQAEATRVGADYQGRGVHEAARIAALAEGGEILASGSSVESIPDLARSVPRSVTLKGLSEPVEVIVIHWQ
jgi:DNA-binding SARP family transcriptional activator/class 3 adenylate cyclase